MNDEHLKKIFAAARKEVPSAPPTNFESQVMQAIARERSVATVSILDQLNLWFPRLAWAAAVIIVVCVAGDWMASANSPSLSDGVSQLSDEWLFTMKGF